MRLASRFKFSYIGYDDISACIAYILFVGLVVATVFATKYGLGIHIWDVDYPRTGVSMQKVGSNSNSRLFHCSGPKDADLARSADSLPRFSTQLPKASLN
jgi:hypothetical protein